MVRVGFSSGSAYVPGPLLLLLQDHHRGPLLPEWPPPGHERPADGVPAGHQYPEALQSIPRGNLAHNVVISMLLFR